MVACAPHVVAVAFFQQSSCITQTRAVGFPISRSVAYYLLIVFACLMNWGLRLASDSGANRITTLGSTRE